MRVNLLDPKQGQAMAVDTTHSPHARLRPLPLDAVSLADDFWEPRLRINREVTLPSQYRHLEETGRLDNFRRASGKIGGEYQGIYFNDSDVYKWLEAAAWTLAEGSDPELERMVDAAITEVEDAQRPDGYLNTYFTLRSRKPPSAGPTSTCTRCTAQAISSRPPSPTSGLPDLSVSST